VLRQRIVELEGEVSASGESLATTKAAAAAREAALEDCISTERATLRRDTSEKLGVQAAAAAKELAELERRAAEELRVARDAEAAAAAAVVEKEAKIASMTKSAEDVKGIQGERVLDLTKQLAERDAALVKLRQQVCV